MKEEPAVVKEPFEVGEERRLRAEITRVQKALMNTGPIYVGLPLPPEQDKLQKELHRLCRQLSVLKNPALETVLT